MGKSIENIWKEGFLSSDALVAPKINNLYSQKSIHIIDKFTRMFRINLIAIVAFSFAFLIVSYFVGIPLTGIIFFVTLTALVVVNKQLLSDLEKIDKGESSYQYLRAFNDWINKQVAINKKMAAFLYPLVFFAMIVGFWFKDAAGLPLGERLVQKLLITSPDLYLIYGVPVAGIIAVVLVLALLALFAGRIYKWDLNIVYGRVFKKLEELMADIEELQA